MLPVYKKPGVQYIVEEAMYSGLTDVVFVNNQNKKIIEDHFDYNWALEDLLERTGKTTLLEEVRSVAEMVNIISVRQKKQLGLGHAVFCAREIIKNEPFAVMLGDDLMFGREPGIKQLMDVAMSENMSVVGVMEVESDKVSSYGIIQGEEFAPGIFRVRSLIEKPKPAQAPSRLAVVGRYVLMPEVFTHLEGTEPGHGGEIQITDALLAMARKNRLLAVKMRGMRFDVGDWTDYLTANIYFALQDETLRDELTRKLKGLLSCPS